MSDHPQKHSHQHALKLVVALTVILSALLTTFYLGGAAQAQPAQESPPVTVAAPSALKFTLGEAVGTALQQHPRIVAQRASLAAAEDGSRALESLRLASLLDPEIPIRRRQACLGITAAAAALDRAERETVYGVTRTYLTVLFAREQERTAKGIVDRMTALRDTAKRALDAGDPNVTAYDVTRTTTYQRLAETQRIQATYGAARALAAFREELGLGASVAVEVPPGALAEPRVRPVHEDVVALALSRRAEIVMASVFVDVTCLEIEAQGTCCVIKQMNTFASASDIHAQPVPLASYDPDFRPGAVFPEMPVTLAGSRAERMRRAQDFNCRATAVLEATRNLITLEAEDAYLRWEQAAAQAAEAREAADAADKLADDLNKDFTQRLKVTIQDVMNARVLAAQSRGQYNEFLYRELVALADLERITAGGFTAGLAELTNPPVPTAPQSKE
jgi:outer membrane protein TolC